MNQLNPKISIITINYNDLNGLQKTMQSVFEQTFTDYEYIVIDGGSTDGSADYIKQHTDRLAYWVSEKDKGVYNAMNKGIIQAKGEYCLFLNSGDLLLDAQVLLKVSKQLTPEYRIYYGDVVRSYPNGEKTIKNYNTELPFSFFVGSSLAHQSTFTDRKLFSEIFMYNEEYKIFSDWEFFVCAICKWQIPYKHLGLTIAVYDMDGISSQPENMQKFQKEKELIYKKHFAAFYKDYEELQKYKSSNSAAYNAFLKIESNPTTNKLNNLFQKVLLKLFFRKNRF